MPTPTTPAEGLDRSRARPALDKVARLTAPSGTPQEGHAMPGSRAAADGRNAAVDAPEADRPDHAQPPPSRWAALLLHATHDRAAPLPSVANLDPVPLGPARQAASHEDVLCRLQTLHQLLGAVDEELTGLLREPYLDHDPSARRVLASITQRVGQDRDLVGGLLRIRGRWAVDHTSHTPIQRDQA